MVCLRGNMRYDTFETLHYPASVCDWLETFMVESRLCGKHTDPDHQAAPFVISRE